MQAQMITPSNAVLATRYLMQMDWSKVVREPYLREVYTWLAPLNAAQGEFLASLSSLSNGPVSSTEGIQKSIVKLAQRVNELTTILSQEAKQELQHWLRLNDRM